MGNVCGQHQKKKGTKMKASGSQQHRHQPQPPQQQVEQQVDVPPPPQQQHPKAAEVSNAECQGANAETINVHGSVHNYFGVDPPPPAEPKGEPAILPPALPPPPTVVRIRASGTGVMAAQHAVDSHVINVVQHLDDGDPAGLVLPIHLPVVPNSALSGEDASRGSGGGGRADYSPAGYYHHPLAPPALPAGSSVDIVADGFGVMAFQSGAGNRVINFSSSSGGHHQSRTGQPRI